MAHTYGDEARARSLAGKPGVTNISDADVAQAVKYGDSMVDTFTGRSDWTTADPEYASIQTASEYFASSYIRDRFADEQGSSGGAGSSTRGRMTKAKEHYERAMQICRDIRSGSQIFIHTQAYRTHPLNEDATPYKSLSGANNSVDDSDLS